MAVAPQQIPQLHVVPRKLWRVWQNKYVLDKQPRWKVCFYWLVYMPVAWVTYFVVKVPICNRVDAEGRLGWEEDQGIYSSKEKATEVIAGRRHWFAKSADEDVYVPEGTCQAGEHLCPGSPMAKLYEHRELDSVSVPQHALKVLARALREGENT
jgi:hypothetical protein